MRNGADKTTTLRLLLGLARPTAGRAEIGTLDQLRHLSALTVEVVLDGVPPDLSGVPGVLSAAVDGHRVRLQVEGPAEPLIEALAGHGVRQLLSWEPSLEELFLATRCHMPHLPQSTLQSQPESGIGWSSRIS